MRRYCKNVDITDTGFIERCIYLWLEKKRSRRDVQRFLAHYTDLTYRQIRKMMRIKATNWLPECIKRVAEDVRRRLIEEKLDLPPIEFKDKYDDVCGKWRRIGIQKPIHQIFDYVAVEACREMFMAKIGPYQMASIPGRGQEKGAKQILKWIQMDPKHCRYWVKGDVRRCYPSIPHDRIKARFARDIKNKKLLWLIYELIDSFPEGLSIGSYFSQFACNYYLSQAYHYAAEQLHKVRRKKSGEISRTRLLYHQIWFMDDVLLIGSSERDMDKAMALLTDYMRERLGLTIKPEWRIYATDYIGADGKHHLFVIAVGMVIDYIIIQTSGVLGFNLPNTMLSLLVTVWYLLNEALSITENAGRMGAPVPGWLMKYIAALKSKIDSDRENTGSET